MAAASVSSRDIHLLGDILGLAQQHRREPAVELAFQVLDRLERLLGCDGVSFQALQVSGPRGGHAGFSWYHAQASEQGTRWTFDPTQEQEPDDQDGAQVLAAYWWRMPCSLPERTGATVVVGLTEVYGVLGWARHPVRAAYLRFVDELLLAYPDGPGRALRVLAPRESGRPFGDRELVLLELLRPHLHSLLAAAAAPPTPPGRSARLTVRQREILGMVQIGMSNRHIARQLAISEGTVRKHLEHAFTTLGVQSRTAAVAALSALPESTADRTAQLDLAT